MSSAEPYERAAAFTGVGISAVGRRLGRGTLDLTLEACLNAIEDAGLSRNDIDGLTVYPSAGYPPEYSPLLAEVQDALRLKLAWYRGSSEGPSPLQAVFNAIQAVAVGAMRHVLEIGRAHV